MYDDDDEKKFPAKLPPLDSNFVQGKNHSFLLCGMNVNGSHKKKFLSVEKKKNTKKHFKLFVRGIIKFSIISPDTHKNIKLFLGQWVCGFHKKNFANKFFKAQGEEIWSLSTKKLSVYSSLPNFSVDFLSITNFQ